MEDFRASNIECGYSGLSGEDKTASPHLPLVTSIMSTPKTDDLDAVRVVVDAIKDFKSDEQQRIFRWVAEKLGLPQPYAPGVHGSTPLVGALPSVTPLAPPHAPPAPGAGAIDIKTFVAAKKPRNDVQFAAVVAYYYRFDAPQAERKDAIDKDDLQEATRKAGRERFGNPLQTLNNAHTLGLLDRGLEKGTFTINSVGENLVAMTLPGDGTANPKPKAKKRPPKKAAKASSKKAASKKTKKA